MYPGARRHELISLSWADGVSRGTELYYPVGAHGLGKTVSVMPVPLVYLAWFASGRLKSVSGLNFHFIFYKKEKSCNVNSW